MAEERKILYGRDVTDLTPEQLRDFVMATEMFNSEYEMERQSQLDPELRYNGVYGLLSSLGNKGGAETIHTYTLQPEDREYAEKSVARGSRGPHPGLYGYYSPFSDREQPPRQYDEFDYLQGAADYGEGVNAFYPLQDTEFGRNYRGKGHTLTPRSNGKPFKDPTISYAETVAHEQTHRGTDSPACRAFAAENPKMRMPGFVGRYKDIGKIPDDVKLEHRYIHSSDPANRNNEDRFAEHNAMQAGDWAHIQNKFRKWLTPERQQQYGVRIPTPAAQPREDSWLQGIMGLLKRNR